MAKAYQKILSSITVLLLLFQSLMPTLVYAQEATDSAIIENNSIQSSDLADSEILNDSSVPTPIPTLETQINQSIDTDAVAEYSLSSPSADLVESPISPSTDDRDLNTHDEVTEGQPNAPPQSNTQLANTQSTPSETPGQLSINLMNISNSDSIGLDISQNEPLSAILTTDKADYAPSDAAVITGSHFPKLAELNLIITSFNYRFETSIKTDALGSFTYIFQLDGNYRPQYKVEVYDLAKNLLSSISFTDSPASGCSIDSGGANDQPGQKDLTKLCADYAGLPASVGISWNWDDANFSGSNTGDACALFDTNSNGKANYAVCVQVGGKPAAYITKYVYSCDDSSATNCLGATVLSPSSATTCTANVQENDPFPGPPNSAKGSGYPFDTVATCTINLNDVGGSNSTLTDVCSYPSASTPSNASDCIVFKPSSGKITLTKVINPSTDTGLFNLQIDGVVANGGSNLGNGGTTLTEAVSLGSHTVGETAGTNSNLSNYNSSIVCRDAHGSGSIISTTGTNPWTLNVSDGSDILCTITNNINNGTLIVKKVVINDNGGTKQASDFSFSVNGVSPQFFESDGQNDLVVTPGTYTVAETGASGYTTTYNNCTNITVSAGSFATCTITNNDQSGSISGIKYSDDNANGIKDSGESGLPGWTINISGSNGFNSSIDTDSSGNYSFSNLSASIYTITETAQVGWIQQTDDPSQINLSNGQLVTGVNFGNAPIACYPDYTQTFEVSGAGKTQFSYNQLESGAWEIYAIYTTDGGGSEHELPLNLYSDGGLGNLIFRGNENIPVANDLDWSVILNWRFEVRDGTTPILSSGFLGEKLINPTTVGTNCSDFRTTSSPFSTTTIHKVNDANGNGEIPQLFGFHDEPMLTGWQINVTDQGGTTISDFTDTNGAATFTLDIGTFTISETSQTGWTQSFPDTGAVAEDCDAPNICTPNADGTWTVVIKNPSKPVTLDFGNYATPRLTVNKIVANDNGGNASVLDFPLFVGANPVLSGFESYFGPGNYTISEINSPGYDQSFLGDCDEFGNISLAPSDIKYCNIINDDREANITLTKVVLNTFGGNALPNDFKLTIDGVSVLSGSKISVTSNEPHTINETNLIGYIFTSISGDSKCPKALGGSVTLDEGEDISCNITNQDVTPTLTLIKNVINDNGGNANPDDFNLTIDGIGVLSGAITPVLANTSISIDETQLSGYNFVYITGDAKCPSVLSGGLTLDEGENITCVITNEDLPGILIVKKIVVNDDGGTKIATDFSFSINDDSSQVFNANGENNLSVNAGTYTVSEPEVSGYTTTYDNCTDVVVTNGGTQTCTITNNDQPASLTVNKILKGPFHLTKDPGSFDILVDGNLEATGITDQQVRTDPNEHISNDVDGGTTQITLFAGSHVISEQGTFLTLTNPDKYNKSIACVDSQNNSVAAEAIGLLDPFSNIPTQNPWSINLSNGQNVTCTITNVPQSLAQASNQIILLKHTLGGDDTFDFSGEQFVPGTLFDTPAPFSLSTSTTAGTNGFDLFGTETSFDIIPITVFPGSPALVTLTEDSLPLGWSFNHLSCIAKDGLGNSGSSAINIAGDTATITFVFGEELTCTYTNTKLPSLTVNKILDPSTDPGLFNLQIDGVDYANDISDGGTTGAQFLSVGAHTVSENAGSGTNIGSYTTTIGGDCDSNGNITLSAGDERVCTITNTYLPPVLTLEKTNDKASVSVTPGSSVLYTLTLTLTGGEVSSVSLIDLLPDGFKYREGSWTAESGVRGNLKSLGIITEPTYASPGSWSIGSMVGGEVITLTLIADINSKVDDGLYKDLTYSTGTAQTQVMANASSGVFVGTEVRVSRDSGGESYEVEKTEEKTQEVLGASFELPATGAEVVWIILASGLFIFGSTMTVAGVILRRKYVK